MRKILKRIFWILIGGLFIFLLYGYIQYKRYQNAPYKIVTLKIGEKNFSLLLADTYYKRKKGLSEFSLEELKEYDADGMLFVFPQEKILSFWTKGISYPISIFFFDEKWNLVKYFICVSPNSEKLYQAKAKYVIELPCQQEVDIEVKKYEEIGNLKTITQKFLKK